MDKKIEEQIRADCYAGKLRILIPLDLLKYCQENRPDEYQFKILDEVAMGEWYTKQILEHGMKEDGETDFARLLDDLAIEAYENAEEWIGVNDEM